LESIFNRIQPMSQEYSQPIADCKRNEGTELSTAEIQAIICFPYFKHIDRDTAIRAGSKIFHTTEKNVEGWRQLSGSDAQNVFVCLLAHLNEWVDGLELSRTPNSGQMQMRNARLTELISGKAGMNAPCLQDFGLSVACAMIPGPQGRKWSFFRLCHAEEVLHKNGKKIPFTPPITSRPRQPIPMQPAPEAPAREAQQSSMFDAGNFVSYETGGRR
jgi:hypothetical protein